ncbi:MAG TPA: penicillin-binding protein 2 [Fimbriimonadaceae bacterium]|nr:penicillin-binding protein 2 [Fimbriimonadaceae bacterium]
MPKPTTRRGRLYYFTWGVIGLFSCAAFTQAKLQVVDRSATLDKARESKRFTLSRVEHAKRGGIYSADERPLAIDQDTYELSINLKRVPQTDAFFLDLSAASGIPASDFEELALSGEDHKVWRESLSARQRQDVQEVKTRWKADGISLDPAGKRTYPLGPAAAAVVGSMMDRTPLVGLERSQNRALEGKDGLTIGLTDRAGYYLPMRMDAGSIPKKDGENLTLTLDSDLQQEAANQIKMAVEKNQADDGIIIVMKPDTGDVLALANYPTFDPTGGDNRTPPDTRKSTKDPIVQDRLEPGSMFKVLTLAKALNDGKVDPNATIDCEGQLEVWAGHSIHCAMEHGTRAHGVVDAEQAIAKSCNVSAATWALRIGYGPMVQYIKDLGLLNKTGIGLPFEANGLFNFDEYAKRLQLATLGFGQSVSVTPIALASAFCMIANHGMQMKPRLIAKIGNKETPIVPLGQRVSVKAADTVFSIMEKVIQDRSGTGFSLRIPGYILAGKTGTAQRISKKDGGGYVSNFMGFVPAPNPKAMILVMIDHPKAGAYYGAAVAGPVWENMAKILIRRYHIPPNDPASLHMKEIAVDTTGAAPRSTLGGEDTPKHRSRSHGDRHGSRSHRKPHNDAPEITD